MSAVWIVWRNHSYDGSTIASMHATEDGAAKAAARQTELRESYQRKSDAYFADDSAEWNITDEEIEANCDGVSVENREVQP